MILNRLCKKYKIIQALSCIKQPLIFYTLQSKDYSTPHFLNWIKSRKRLINAKIKYFVRLTTKLLNESLISSIEFLILSALSSRKNLFGTRRWLLFWAFGERRG